MDNLESCIGLAGTSRHDEENTILPTGHCINGAVNCNALIIARCLITRLEIIRLSDELLLFRCEVLVPYVPQPKILR